MEWFLKALKKDYANFNGRACREEYWMFVLFSTLAYIVIFAVLMGLMLIFNSQILGGIMITFFFIYVLGIIVPTLAVTVRRLHDTNRSGWAYFMSFIPFVGPIILMVYLCSEGTLGANRYGPDPKAEQPTDQNIGIIQ